MKTIIMKMNPFTTLLLFKKTLKGHVTLIYSAKTLSIFPIGTNKAC